jgi:hypothetical protein
VLSAHGLPAKVVAELVKAKLVTTELVARMVTAALMRPKCCPVCN